MSQSGGPQPARGAAQGIGWLAGDFNGDGRTDLVHLRDVEGRLGIGFYIWSDQVDRLEAAWLTENAGAGSGALAWRVADIDGDGTDEILQPWRNDSRVGLIVYSWDNREGGFHPMAQSSNLGLARDSVAWLAGDLDGDGAEELVQLWRNRGRLAAVRYDWLPEREQLRVTWEAEDVGQGADALQYLMADFDGDGRADIAQAWLNGDRVGVILHEWRGGGEGLRTRYAVGKVAHAHDEAVWATGDMDGDGKAEIVYGWVAEGAAGLRTLIWRMRAERLDPAFVIAEFAPFAGSWEPLTGDFDGDGAAELIAHGDNGAALHVLDWNAEAETLSGWYDGAFADAGRTLDWVVGDVDGDGRSELVRVVGASEAADTAERR